MVITAAVIALFIYGLRESNREWTAAKPAALSEEAWETKRESCRKADLGADECAHAADSAIQKLIVAKVEAKRQTLCVDDAQTAATRQAQKMAMDQLRAPATADFVSSTTRASHVGCDWTVSGSVDAQNAFGANIRSRYRVRLQPVSSELWAPLSVKIE